MRTTLAIGCDILSLVKDLARIEQKSKGKILSDLARTTLTMATEASEVTGPGGAVLRNGRYVLPKRGAGSVTNESVDRLFEEVVLEGAGVNAREPTATMRTTLEIDDDVLQAAKELASAENTTAGRVLSDLARKALTALPSEQSTEDMVLNGFYMRSRRGGAIVTSDLVDRILDEADLEEAGLKGS